MKLKADRIVTEIKKDISSFDSSDLVALGMGILGILLFIILILEIY